jgi:hypothetical protein
MPARHYLHQFRALIDQGFNWTTLERGTPEGRETRWLCVRVWGTERELKGSILRNGRSTGSGCHRGPGAQPSFDRLADRYVALPGELDLLEMRTQLCAEPYGDLELSRIHPHNVESLGRVVRNVRLCLLNVR